MGKRAALSDNAESAASSQRLSKHAVPNPSVFAVRGATAVQIQQIMLRMRSESVSQIRFQIMLLPRPRKACTMSRKC